MVIKKVLSIMWLAYPGKVLLALCYLLAVTTAVSANPIQRDEASEKLIFARINQRSISYDEFRQIFHQAVRYKYYHGKVPEKELLKFQRQVASDIVEQVLLYQQAIKLGLQPDNEKIQAGLAEYDKKYAAQQEWQLQKEKTLAFLLDRLKRQDLIEQMQARIKHVAYPENAAIKAFYQRNPEKFTEPKRVWLSVILLAVPASSTEDVWLNAEKAARQFIQKINDGEDFSAIAHKYSAHPSAVNGGDLGYLHQGMLEGDAIKVVENMHEGELSQPVRVLEGVTIFRLNGIQAAKLRPFESVKDRAAGLLYRELQDMAWSKYLKDLHQSADIFINEKLYASINKELLKK